MLFSNGTFDVNVESAGTGRWLWKIRDRKRKTEWLGETDGGFGTAKVDIQESIDMHLLKVCEAEGLI